MKVILLKNIDRLGKKGELVEVKDGYARNYLIPQGLVLQSTKDNFKKLEIIKNKEKKLLAKYKDEAMALKERIEELSLTIATQAKDEHEIFGSIGEGQILKALTNEGIPEEKLKLSFSEPIRKLGVYNLEVTLHPEVTAMVRVWIVKK